MSYEIHVSKVEVSDMLGELKSSIQSLEVQFPTRMTTENGLAMTEQFNEINTSIENFLATYHTFLIHSEESTRKSIEVMKESDKELSAEIQLLK